MKNKLINLNDHLFEELERLNDEELKVTRMMNGADRNSKLRVKNDIEVNEYVRINMDNRNCIGIGRVSRIVNETIYVNMNNKYNLPVSFQIDKVVNHSKQLIDLIEVGDIVRIRTGLYSSFMEFIDNEECLLILKEQVKKFWTIEEILTKESYMANCYKVGGEDE